ncbi:hypothetical protein WME70_32745, partial [Microcoleus anatoxicus PTRS1]
HVASLKPKIIVIQVGVNDLKAIPLFPEQKEAIIRNCETNIAILNQLCNFCRGNPPVVAPLMLG